MRDFVLFCESVIHKMEEKKMEVVNVQTTFTSLATEENMRFHVCYPIKVSCVAIPQNGCDTFFIKFYDCGESVDVCINSHIIKFDENESSCAVAYEIERNMRL